MNTTAMIRPNMKKQTKRKHANARDQGKERQGERERAKEGESERGRANAQIA